jgi:hypothetical protein
MVGGWGALHNRKFHNLYSSPNKIRMIKSGRMRWTGHVARIREEMNACRILQGEPEGKRPLGRLRYRWRIILKCILENKLTGLIWLRIGTSGGLL